MNRYQHLEESSVDMQVFNGSEETCAEKKQKSKPHAPSSSGEKIFLQENEKTPITKTGRWQKLMGDKIFWTKVFHTCLLNMAIVFQGWIKSQFGPVYIDLQKITGAGPEECSWLITVSLIGQMIASPIGGVLYAKANSSLSNVIAHLGAALTVCCIPWCSLFPLMMTAYFILGMFLGAISTIVNTEIFYIWEDKGNILIQGLHLMFAIGGVLSPPITALFLSPPDDLSDENRIVNEMVIINNQHIHSTTAFQNFVSNTENDLYVYTIDNISTSSTHRNFASKTSSRLYIAFFITGAFGVMIAVGFLVLFVKSLTHTYALEKVQTEKNLNMKTTLSKVTKYGAVLALSAILLLSAGIDYGYNTFLVSFVVKQLNWTKTMGSTLTSLVFLFETAGTVLALFLIRFVSPETLTAFHCVVSVITCIGLLISALFTANIGIWVFGSLFGYARSIILPTVFVWVNDRLFPLSAQVSSVFMTAWAFGAVINPVILGYVIDSFSNIWFCYVILGENILLLGVCIISFIMTKIIVARKGQTTIEPIK